MKRSISLPRLKDISVRKKVYFVVGTMAVLIVIELFALWFSIHTLSSVRAFVGGEGLWSKSQKDAFYHLKKYYRDHKEEDYQLFHKFMSVPLGDHKALVGLSQQPPDMEAARQGFLQGRIHEDDINGMIDLITRFHEVSYINRALSVWGEADSMISKLIPIAEQIHKEIQLGVPSQEKLDRIVSVMDPVNAHLTVLEDNFSFTLGEGSRWLENLVLKLLLVIALTVEITGLLLSISVSRSITRGLNEINKAADKITKGDLSVRATVFSQDEIGQIAIAINRMTEQLINSNRELSQFAYIASHDLQEPLRMVSSFLTRLEQQYNDQLDDKGRQYIHFATDGAKRMRTMILDLLQYSSVGNTQYEFELMDMNALMKEFVRLNHASIDEKNASVTWGDLPVIKAARAPLLQVFQNLIANGIKYQKPGSRPEIDIQASETDTHWQFSVSDNGIGVEPQFFEKIFVVFQRLHNKNEYSGTGIGLAICKKIIESHQGQIWIESTVGEGSTFYFTIHK
jgi:signal transduction histidine kinase